MEAGMERVDFITELLEQLWPDECDLAGDSNIRDLVLGDVEFKRVFGASNISLEGALTVLASAVTVIKTTIEIYDSLQKKLGHKPSAETLLAEQTRSEEGMNPQAGGIFPEKRRAVVNAVLKRDNK
jgi:hypothetical protein